MNKIKDLIVLVLLLLIVSSSVASAYNIDPHSQRAIEVADNIIAWQTNSGGWTKNTDFTQVKWEPGVSKGPIRDGLESGTFDNEASTDEMRFLAKVYQATGEKRFKDSFMRGLEWMLDAQYPSGGWPQYYPQRDGYWGYVTFNDRAMQRVLEFIQEILNQPHNYTFLVETDRDRLQQAYQQGIDYIVKSQIEVNGHLTAWCQQHDPVTYEPLMGRTFEPIAIVSAESVAIIHFLMSLPDPSIEVKRAILSAIDWFKIAQLPGGNWSRFYSIESNTPIFSGRNSVIQYKVADIERERQEGYSWYNFGPNQILRLSYIDTLILDNGLHDLNLETYTNDGTHLSHRVRFLVDNPENRW